MNTIELGPCELPVDSKWLWIHFQGFIQDVTDWTNEETGEYFPATFNWIGTIKGQRVKDGGYFYQRGTVLGKEGEPINLESAKFTLEMMRESLERFSGCDCVVNHPCYHHGEPFNGNHPY